MKLCILYVVSCQGDGGRLTGYIGQDTNCRKHPAAGSWMQSPVYLD